jgi:GTPase SAR1 family protein
MTESNIEKRLKTLENHLAEESRDNPTLFQAVQSFRELDKIAYHLGILDNEESYATRVSWWPMIAVLGTFSAGKSTFINSYLEQPIQRTGNQAVDDKFSVICYTQDAMKTLPGVALDADPRFPFFQISQNIAEISATGKQRIDAYLQLKTCPSESLRGKIIIDSPGFDADSQRASTLRLTEHIISLADLVLVFFDARHPEPGAMHDTLDYLVTATIDRADSNKFLYILNQIDITAREDNPEDVVAAWQRALAQAGLTAGRFYRIYDKKMAAPIDDPQVRERFERKRDADMADIEKRMQQVDIERCYRIVGTLEETAKNIENTFIPRMNELLQAWKKRVIRYDVTLFFIVAIVLGIALGMTGTLDSLIGLVTQNHIILAIILLLFIAGSGYIHFFMRKLAKQKIMDEIKGQFSHEVERKQYQRAFNKNTPWWKPLFITKPLGWNQHTRRQISNLLATTNEYIQRLNDRFTNPSGK